MTARIIGIDLGTTHTALAHISPEGGPVEVLAVPQLVRPGALERSPLLPSALYLGLPEEPPMGLPWDTQRPFAVGQWAKRRGSEVPQQVVTSAKSWLVHPTIDRRSGLLPLGAPAELERISPVEASFRFLDHLAEAWLQERPDAPSLAESEVILTVPASFDAAARDLTVEAAYAAGLENVHLLEEPQAALYAWIEHHGEQWRKHLRVGDVVLVIDIGGGTTDFSAITVDEDQGDLQLRRVAVGEHILLGGDNIDAALAALVQHRLKQEGKQLDRWQVTALTHATRDAKELLLSAQPLERAPVAIPTRGSQLIGSTLRAELAQAEVRELILNGFFPVVPVDARPLARPPRAGLTQVGLPYAHDPAVTRHLAAFLGSQNGALGGTQPLLCPTKVLFNGGVMKAPCLRERLMETLNSWLAAVGAPAATVLPGDDPDLAVARGAAYFGAVRRGRGIRIRGGTAHAYYVGMESPMPAIPGFEPPLLALCVAPFGMEEGSVPELLPQELAVVVGEPVSFRFFRSSVRRDDRAGLELEHWSDEDLTELSPVEVTLPAEGRGLGEVVPVQLSASVTAVGTLLLEAVPLQPAVRGERWKLELAVRHEVSGAQSD